MSANPYKNGTQEWFAFEHFTKTSEPTFSETVLEGQTEDEICSLQEECSHGRHQVCRF